MRVHPSQIDLMLHPAIAEGAKKKVIAKAGSQKQRNQLAFETCRVDLSSSICKEISLTGLTGLPFSFSGSSPVAFRCVSSLRFFASQGLPASPGAAIGKVVFSADEAGALRWLWRFFMVSLFLFEKRNLKKDSCLQILVAFLRFSSFWAEAVQRLNDGEKVILVRDETSADDIHGMHAAEGEAAKRRSRGGN